MAGPEEKARRERRDLVFVDESGFYLLPGVVKTYAPEGPRRRSWTSGRRETICRSWGASPSKVKVYSLVRPSSLNGLHIIEFLLHLGRVVGIGCW